MNVSRLKLITFDVTNTLLKFRSAPGKQYGEIGALYGVLSDDNKLAANFKTYWYKMNKEHPNFGLKSGLGWENWWKMVVKGTFERSDFNMDESKLSAIATHLIDLYKTSACWQPCFGALDLLTYLESRKITLGVISNFDPRCSTTLTNTKLRDYFQFVLTSYEVGVEKPDPGIFQEAMKVSNIEGLKPEDCLHIGDRIMLDYAGAKNSKWNAFLISDAHRDKIKRKYPDVNEKHVFSNLYDIYKYLSNNCSEQKIAQKNC